MPLDMFAPCKLFYDGRVQASTSDKIFQSVDPSTGHVLANVHEASKEDVDAAVASAQKAFKTWSLTPTVVRCRILLKAAEILRRRNDEIAEIETRDTGKPFSETSTVDVITGADVLEYFANLVGGGALNGETIRLRRDAVVYTSKEPLGVCAGIGAWNYPIQIALWKSAPCLAAGNTMVYKPSEVTPLHAQVLAQVYMDAGLPAGAFNIVQGAGHVGAHLVSHAGIAKVSFTGQVSTGQTVASTAAHEMKYITMELGGKSPLIICADADVDGAADVAMMANFFSSGQVCTNGTRVFVPDAMKQAFETKLLEKMQHVRAGNPMDARVNFGPLVSQAHYNKVVGYIEHGIHVDKARLLCGGVCRPPGVAATEGKEDVYGGGYWLAPTIFTDCTDSMKIVQEEIFGPVMSIQSYSSIEQAIQSANNTRLGLAAGVFTRDIKAAHDIVSRLEAGIAWINTWGESPAEMSVGGWKLSGVGVENGKRGIEAWVRSKSCFVSTSERMDTVFKD